MYLKLMSGEDLADSIGSKKFTLIECKNVNFTRDERGVPTAWADGQDYYMSGNAYVMSDAGKTISAFAFTSPPQDPE